MKNESHEKLTHAFQKFWHQNKSIFKSHFSMSLRSVLVYVQKECVLRPRAPHLRQCLSQKELAVCVRQPSSEIFNNNA